MGWVRDVPECMHARIHVLLVSKKTVDNECIGLQGGESSPSNRNNDLIPHRPSVMSTAFCCVYTLFYAGFSILPSASVISQLLGHWPD